jgi:hypothetical protein
MFENRKAAERKAQKAVEKRDYKSASGKKSAQTQITNRKEREIDEWTRNNVGLD